MKEVRNPNKIEWEKWDTEAKIVMIDKKYKERDPKLVSNAILDGAWTLIYTTLSYISTNLDLGVPLTIGFIIAGLCNVLTASLNLEPIIDFKFKKKSLEKKLSKLEEELLNSKGIFTVGDYEVITTVDEEQLKNQLLNINDDLSKGGQNVR